MSIHHVDRGAVLHINIEEKVQSAAWALAGRIFGTHPLIRKRKWRPRRDSNTRPSA
jgi:hypothetical protein